MPKASPLQPSFSGGEFSPRVQGRVDSERYKTGLAVCLNYLPTTQGPLLRRPGTKYVAQVKDPSKPPNLIEFKFSQSQNYVLEFGDQYVRFYTNGGQMITTSTHVKVAGGWGTVNIAHNSSNLYAMRSTGIPNANEVLLQSSVIAAGSILEIQSPYVWPSVFDLKVAQKNDTLYIVHSSYPEYKLQRLGDQLWDLKKVNNIDGPYLGFNQYLQPVDSTRIQIYAQPPTILAQDGSQTFNQASTGPIRYVSSITSAGASGYARINSPSHNFFTGDRVVIQGVAGVGGINNTNSTFSSQSWQVLYSDANNFDLIGSTYSAGYTGSGVIYPALFQPTTAPTNFADVGRVIGLVRRDGNRSWGTIESIQSMATFTFHVDSNFSPLFLGTSAQFVAAFWQMGVWNQISGYPNAVCFHQDRKFLAGAPGYPQDLQASVSGDYDNFASSNSSFVVADNNSLAFGLNSAELNAIYWLKSDAEGLLAGSRDSEWLIAPNNQAAAVTPTNITAKQTSFFGSANSDAVQTGNATLYIQRAQRRLREMNYFFQVNTYRSTDLAELSEHITNPAIYKLSVQKETLPVVWAKRTDGTILSMVYNRDDTTLKVGWARHRLGGNSDSGGTQPLVKAIAVIPAPDASYDQLWCVVQRFINNTSVVTVEVMTKPFDNLTAIEDSYHLDCGATYDSPIVITGISSASRASVTATSHGFSNGDTVKITDVVGLNSSLVSATGVVFNSNLVNENTFLVASTTTNAFYLRDFNSSFIDSTSYSPYISGGNARKLITTISGLTWLKGETVGVLADGKVHAQTQINSAGVLALSYPAAKVQIGYAYNSDGQTLRPEAGSGDGSSIGKLRNVGRAAFLLYNVGDFQIGNSFNDMTPIELFDADNQSADQPSPLFSGITRESLLGYDFEGQVCFRQSTPLPGMIQTVTVMMETSDV